ncbi:24338_t:CDS:1, partial [Gigaspora margarita]
LANTFLSLENLQIQVPYIKILVDCEKEYLALSMVLVLKTKKALQPESS